MTIQSGSRIDADDYNNMQSKVANVLGTGSGNKGYGQPVLSRAVSATNTITAAQMQNLRTDLDKIKYHQTNTATLTPPILANTLIKASDWLVYNQEATDLETARFTLSSDITQSTRVVNLQRTYTTWNGTQTHNVIVDFGSANSGRYFFNSGGEIVLEPSHSSNTLDKGANWAALFASFVPVRFTHSTTTARAGTATNIGWYGLTTNDQIIFTIATTGTYAGNNYTVKARCDVSNNSTGAARYLFLTIELSDIGANPALDLNVDGVTTNKVSNNRATGSYVEVPAPTITDNYVTPPATYSLTANPATQSNEGATIIFTLATSNLPSGTLVPYTISGTGITTADFGGALLTGNFTLDANGFGSVIYNTAIDQSTEGNETLTLRLNNNAASIAYVIIDTSLSFPTITTAPVIQMLPSTEVEGILSIVSNTVWSPSNSGFAQFALWQSSTNGTTFIDTPNFNLTYTTVTSDIGKYWRLRQASTNFETYAYSNVIGPVKLTQTYALTASPTTSATEGTSVTITLTTFNVNNGSFPYTISGTGITAADFGLSSLSGSFTLVNSTASITLNLVNDQNQSEVSEDFTISLDNGKANLIYRINDPLSQYTFTSPSPMPESVDEGSSIIFEVSTVNVYLGTLYWDIDYNNSSQAADFTAPNGSFPLDSNTGTFEVNITNDLIKEGIQSFRVRIRTGSSTATPPGSVVLTSNLININDTSTTVIATLAFERSSYLIGLKAVLNWTIDGAEYDTIRATILKPDNTALSTSGSLAKAIRTFTSSSVFNIEGEHTGRVELFKGTTKMAQSEIKTIVGAAPTYSLSRDPATGTGSENSPFTFKLTTTNVDEGVQIPFSITRSTSIVSLTNNFSSWVLNGVSIPPSLTGNFVARSGGTNPDIATLVITPADDRITESSNETVTLTLGSPGSGSINYVIKDPNLTAAAFSFTPLIDQEPNSNITSGNVTITGLEPNLSTAVTATGGLVDAGTTDLSGTFAASKTIPSSQSGTILVAAQVTTGASGKVAKSVTITVNAKTNAIFTATTRLGDVDGNLSNPTNATNVELNTPVTVEAVFTELEKSASISVTAASGSISNNSSSGFGTSCTLTTDINGQASIWYRLTSSNAVSSTVNMGTLTVKVFGGTKTYAPNWSVTTRATDISGAFTNAPSLINQDPNIPVTSDANTISGLQTGFAFRLAIDSGLIGTSKTGTFASSISSITSTTTGANAGVITFYYRVTTPTTFRTPISVGTLTLTGGGESETYSTDWSATTRAFKILGPLTTPANVTGSPLSTVQTSGAATISNLEKSYTYTITLTGAIGPLSPTFNLTPSASSVNEGSSVTFNISGTNIIDGPYYWMVSNAGDFAANTAYGYAQITNNSGSFSVTPTTDLITEGPETIVATLYAPGNVEVVATSTPVTINDTSLSSPQYKFRDGQPTSVNEGSSITFNVDTANVPNGTTLYWTANTITGEAGLSEIASTRAGNFTITNNTGTFSIGPTLADSLTEGDETFRVNVRTISTSGTSVLSSTITIKDTSTSPLTPTYAVTPSATSVNEGSSVTFTVTATNVANPNAALYWSIAYITGQATNVDFTIVGSTLPMSNGTGTFTVTPKADSLTEGAQTFAVSIRNGSSTAAILVTSVPVTINDTSVAPATPTYAFGPLPTSVNEGSTLTITVNTTNVPNGSTCYWGLATLGVNVITAPDLNFTGPVTGTFTITGNTGSFSLNIIADNLTEGAETFFININGVDNTPVLQTPQITVNDTSVAPATPTYAFGTLPTSVNEGSTLTVTVNTTNVPNGSTCYWGTSTIGVNVITDPDVNSRTGSFTITGNTGSFSFNVIADNLTEGAETFVIDLYGVGNIFAIQSGLITVNDTSTTPIVVYTTYGDTTSALLYGAHTTGGGAFGASLNATMNGDIDGGTWISNGTTKIAQISSGGLVNVWFPLIPTLYGDVTGTLYQHRYCLGTGDLTPVVSPNSAFCWRAPQSNWTDSNIQGMLGFNSTQLSNVQYATRVWWNYFLSGMNQSTACGFAILKANQYAIGKQTCWNNRENFYLAQVDDNGGEWQEQGFTFEPTVSGITLSNVGNSSFTHIGATGRGVITIFGVNGESNTNLRSDYTWTLGPDDLVIPIMRSDSGFSGGARNGPRNPASARFGMMVPQGAAGAKGNQGYTVPGTYTWLAPAGVTEANALVIGGGGAGGGGSGRTAYAGFYTGGGGGGASKAVYRWLSVTPGNSYTVVVGAGGAKGTSRDGVYSSGSDGGGGSYSYITGFDDFSTSILSGGGFGGTNSPTGTKGQSGNVGGGTAEFGSGAFDLVTAQSGLNAGSGTTRGGLGAPGYTFSFSTSVALESLVSFGSYGTSYAEGSGQFSSGGTGYGAGGTGGGCVQSDELSANNMYATDGAPGAVLIWWGYATQKVAANYGGGATPPAVPAGATLSTPGLIVVDGVGSNIVGTIPNALTTAQFEAPTIGAITPMAATSALISANATTGFATSINITSSSTGVLTFYYRLTSSSEYAGSVTFGDFILGGNGETQQYDSTWNVSNGTPDVTGNYSGPASLTTYELNTVKTSAAATITALQANFVYTLSAATGSISANSSSGFASTISITSSADNAITFYYRLTSSGTVGQAVSMGTLTLSAGSTTKTYAPNWSVTTKAVDMSGSLGFNPISKTNATKSTTYTTTITYSGLEPNYTFTISNSGIDIGPAIGNTSSTYSFTTDGNGSHTFIGSAISSSSFGGVVSAGTWTLSATGQTPTTIAANWSVTTGVANINGTISSPTNVTGATRSQAYTAEVSLTGFEPNVTFTISHTGSPGKIGTSSSSFSTSINVSTDGDGSATIWYQLTASSSYISDVSMPALTITGGGANRSYTPTWKVTTSASPTNVPIPAPTGISDAFLNTWYSRPVEITGAIPGTAYTLSIYNVPAGTLSPGQLSNNNLTWGLSTSFTINSSGKATVYYRLYSGSLSPVTTGMPALLLTVNSTSETKQFTTGWTVTTRTNYSSPPMSLSWTGSGSQQNASPNAVYSFGPATISGLSPNFEYTVVGTAFYPGLQTYRPQIDESYVLVSAGGDYAREITARTDSTGKFNLSFQIKALPASGTIVAYPVVINPITGRWASTSIYSVRVV